ncbi:hypothetical protein WDW86_03980 [Bdellovibrionota bacterium FG-2]
MADIWNENRAKYEGGEITVDELNRSDMEASNKQWDEVLQNFGLSLDQTMDIGRVRYFNEYRAEKGVGVERNSCPECGAK